MKRIVKQGMRHGAPAGQQRQLLSPATFGGTSYLQPWDRLAALRDTADKETIVAALTQAIATDLAAVDDLPIKAEQLGTDEDVTDRAWYAYALNVAPSVAMDAATFRQHYANAMNFSGECYIIEAQRTLTPLIGGTVEIGMAGAGQLASDGSPLLIGGYKVRDEAGTVRGIYDGQGRALGEGAIPGSILHRVFIPHPENPLRANPPVAAAKLPTEVLHLQRQATKTILQNDGVPAAVMTLNPPVEGATLTQEQLVDAEQRINAKWSGSKRKVVLMNAGASLQPFLSRSPLDAGWKAVADQARDDILAVWRAPLSVLGVSEGVTFENQRISLRHYYSAVLLPLLALLTSTLNQHALRQGYRLTVDTSQVAALNEDSLEVAKRVALMADVATLNERRELHGLPPVDGGDTLPGQAATADTGQPDGGEGARGLPFELRAAGPSPDAFSDALDAATAEHEDELAVYAQKFHARTFRMIEGGIRRRAGLAERIEGSEVGVPDVNIADIIDPSARDLELLADLAPMLESASVTVGSTVARELGDEVTSTALTAWRETAGNRVQRLVTGTAVRPGWTAVLAADVQAAVNAAHAAGESVDGAMARVADALGTAGKAGEVAERAERIARTELGGLMNDVTLTQFEASGVVKAKRWYTIGDDRTRESHLALNGVEIPMGDRFSVGGHPADGPHDPSLPASEVVNCRCRLIPVV